MKTRVFVLCAVVSLAAVVASAGPQARLAGAVTDSTGTPITTAVVTITTDEQTTFEKVLQVDDEGTFKTMLLDATKRYLFTVEAAGYEILEMPFKVGVGTTDHDNFFDLQLTSVQEVAGQRRGAHTELPGREELEAGNELVRQNRLEPAREQFEKALAADPTLLPAMENLATVLLRLNDFEVALKTAESCLDEDDESQPCLAVAANASRELGDDANHRAYMTRYQDLNPEDPTTLFNQAVEFLNKMDDDNARPLIEKCLEVDHEFPRCLFEYGMLLLRSGDIEGAKANLEKFIQVAPDSPDAVTAQETVKYL